MDYLVGISGKEKKRQTNLSMCCENLAAKSQYYKKLWESLIVEKNPNQKQGCLTGLNYLKLSRNSCHLCKLASFQRELLYLKECFHMLLVTIFSGELLS